MNKGVNYSMFYDILLNLRDNKQQNNDISYYLAQIFCKNPQNLVKQRITPHFLTTDHPNYYEFTTKE